MIHYAPTFKKGNDSNMKQLVLAFAAFAAAQLFAGPLDNAWLRGTTDKTPIDYKAGEPMAMFV